MARASHSLIERYERSLQREASKRPRRGPAGSKRPLRDRSRRSRRRAVPRARARVRRILVIAFVLCTSTVAASLGGTIAAPSNSPIAIRVVEWLRDNGAASLVSGVERAYYSWTGPSKGGPALRTLPQVGTAAAAGQATSYRPAPIAPSVYPPLPGEGQWHSTGLLVRGAPPVLLTTFRPDPSYPQLVAGVAWIDSTRAWIQLYPGRYEPPNAGATSASVPSSLRAGLLATFNSGFKLEDDSGGFVALGRTYAPLKDGQATFVRYRDGTAEIRAWTGGPDPGPNVEFARQNLPLILNDGQLNPNLADGPQWGATLGNAVRVWRSGVGIDAHGNLIYAAANDQTAQSLAEILRRSGAVRAMELDINSEWVTFSFYGAWNANAPQKLLPDMSRDASRYLMPDDRDFFAVYARNGA